MGEHLEILPAQQQIDVSWYKGTADSVYQNLEYIARHHPKYVLILAGDHIYKMDYGPMIAHHLNTEANITVGTVEVPQDRAREFGVLAIDDKYRVTSFVEKPEVPDPIPGRDGVALASMGIYVFSFDFLKDILEKDALNDASSHDFGKDIIPGCIGNHRVTAYVFQDAETRAQHYWRDVGNVDAFYEANMELTRPMPELNLYDVDWPIWTYQEQIPPAKFVPDEKGNNGRTNSSMISGGCIVAGAEVIDSFLFSNVRVASDSHVESSVVLPDARIGRNCRLKKVVIDEDCVVPDGTIVGENHEQDRRRFFVTNQGVVLITQAMLETES
jgi:glucose-1-phosphate adenylyltransferase